MKKIISFLLAISTIQAIGYQNLHRYMWASYRQFGGHNQQASAWYDEINSSARPTPFSNKGYIHLLNSQNNFQRIVELIPKLDPTFQNDPEIQLIFVTALKKTGNIKGADERLITLNKTFKTHPEVTFNTAESFIRRKEMENALATIDSYLNNAPRRPNNFIFYFLKSQIYTQTGDFKAAHENITQCLEAHPRFPQGWLLLALIEEQTGKIDKAIEGYTSYLEITGNNKQIEQHLLNLVLKQKAISQNKQVITINRSCFEKSMILFERKDYKGALKQINMCLSDSPQDTQMRLLKLEIMTALHQFDEVITILTTWSCESDDPHIWLKVLHLLSRAKPAPRDKIISALERIHSKKPTMILPILYLADIHSRLQHPHQALVFHEKAVPLIKNPELKSRILFQIGLIHYDNRDMAQMVEALEQTLALATDYPPALNLLAYYYATEGKQFGKAFDLIGRALKKDPTNAHFLDTKALVLYKQHKYKEAVAILEPVVKRIPNDSTALIHLAKAYNRLGEFNKACTLIGDAKKCAITPYEKQTTTALIEQWKQ